jgi:hypothetical protein
MLNRFWISLIITISLVQTEPLIGSECNECHAAKDVRESIPDIGSIKIRAEGISRSISLSDAFGFHGHSCPGVTTTFRALQYGIFLLFGDETPDLEDLVIVSRTPTSGSLDLLDLIMIGEERTKKTAAPVAMPSSRENFAYTLYRKSNSTAVDIRMKPEHYPEDFFDLKKKQSARRLSSEEWDTLHNYMKNIILTFPNKPFEELFGKPKPYKTIVWGNLLPAHEDSKK